MKKDIVPNNETGKQVDLSEAVALRSTEEAVRIYSIACERLLHPSFWKSITAKSAADFKPETKQISAGDHIQINIPGPGLSAGGGYDWVRVESIKENVYPAADQSLAMTVKVCENPESPDKGVAHFFAEGATSTFIITRNGTKVNASYHGRNEKPNFENPSLGDKIRNAMVAIGAMIGLSELQWKSFLKGLLNPDLKGNSHHN